MSEFKKEKIEELLKIRETETVLHGAMEEIKQAMNLAPHECSSDLCKKITGLYLDAFNEAEAAMIELHRRKYDEEFSEAEIDALLSIHQHPAWKKALKVFDGFDRDMDQVLQARLSVAADQADKLKEEARGQEPGEKGRRGRKGKNGKNGHDSA